MYNIVVVDDEPVCLATAKAILTEEKMNVVCLRSGEQLLRYVERNTPDLILLDILMPELDGFDTYISLRQFEDHIGRAHIPVIFLSAAKNTENEEMGLILGASDFVAKPINRDTLIRRIEHSIKNSRKIEDLTEEATLDKLTGFLNKAKGTERVAKLCRRKKGALVIFDLDSFKLVNDLFGHEAGDEVLKAFADVIRKNTRETDTLCRIGGDEFMAFYEDLTDVKALKSMSRRFNMQLAARAKEILGEDHGIPLGISMGVVLVPDQGTDYQALFSMADSALYKVKQNGKHGYAVYSEDSGCGDRNDDNPLFKLEKLEKIMEERNDKEGALILGKEAFGAVYRFVVRFYRRYGGSAALLLFDLIPFGEEEDEPAAEADAVFSSILEKNLRMSDIVMQSGTHSYFMMLTECSEPDIQSAINRITKAFEKTEYSKTMAVHYVFKYLKKIPKSE